jgi:hypothetical protein
MQTRRDFLKLCLAAAAAATVATPIIGFALRDEPQVTARYERWFSIDHDAWVHTWEVRDGNSIWCVDCMSVGEQPERVTVAAALQELGNAVGKVVNAGT